VTEPDVRPVLVIGLGNELRGDDGAGVEVARRLRGVAAAAGIDVRVQQGEPAGLIDAWSGRKAVLVVDTMRSGAALGTVCRFDVSREPLPAQLRGFPSTHALSLAEVFELARAMGQLPPRVVVFAIEGQRFQTGAALSDEVQAVIAKVAGMVLDEARR
jgi:hydrogenase maturation protease